MCTRYWSLLLLLTYLFSSLSLGSGTTAAPSNNTTTASTSAAAASATSAAIGRLRAYLLRPIPGTTIAAPRRYDPSLPFLLPPLLAQVANDIATTGFAVVDGLLGQDGARRALAQAIEMQRRGAFQPCEATCESWSCGKGGGGGGGGGGGSDVGSSDANTIRGDLTLWEHQWGGGGLEDERSSPRSSPPSSPPFEALEGGLQSVVSHLEILGRLLSHALSSAPSSQQAPQQAPPLAPPTKLRVDSRSRALLSYYGRGRGYLPHFDNPFPALSKDPRMLTLLYYMNEEWDAARDGGVLRVEPTRDDGAGKTVRTPVGGAGGADGAGGAGGVVESDVASSGDVGVEIAPVMDRWVIMDAQYTRHEVTSVNRARFALTVWLTDSNLDPLRDDPARCTACTPL